MTVKVEEREIKYALIGMGSILVWFLWIQKLIAPYLETMHPLLAMFVYNFGLFVGLYYLSAPLDGKKIRWKMTLITFVVFLGIDILYAPYLVSQSGVVNTSIQFWNVSTDAAFGSFFNSMIPSASFTFFGYSLVWLLTYILMPILLMLFFPILILRPHEVAKLFGH